MLAGQNDFWFFVHDSVMLCCVDWVFDLKHSDEKRSVEEKKKGKKKLKRHEKKKQKKNKGDLTKENQSTTIQITAAMGELFYLFITTENNT